MRVLDYMILMVPLSATIVAPNPFPNHENSVDEGAVAGVRFKKKVDQVRTEPKDDRVAETVSAHARLSDTKNREKGENDERHQHLEPLSNEISQQQRQSAQEFNKILQPHQHHSSLNNEIPQHQHQSAQGFNKILQPNQHHALPESNPLKRVIEQHRERDQAERIAAETKQRGQESFDPRHPGHHSQDSQEGRAAPLPHRYLYPKRISGFRSIRGDEFVYKWVEGEVTDDQSGDKRKWMTWEKFVQHSWNALAMTTAMRVAIETTALSTLGPVGLLVVEEAVRRMGSACIPNMVEYLRTTDWKHSWPFSFPRPEMLPDPNGVGASNEVLVPDG